MGRHTIWFMLVILLAGILFLREPRLQRAEEIFLRWLINHSTTAGQSAPLTIVEIGGKPPAQKNAPPDPTEKFLQAATGGVNSPLVCALLVQAALEFNPPVVAFEPVLKWPESAKAEQQILVDQAIRVPKLLLAAELIPTSDPDAPVTEVAAFPNVTGRRGDLAPFAGIGRQPDEDLRLISTLGFVNLPQEVTDEFRAPLLFEYRGDVIPSFALQAAMMWMRVTPGEVKIDIGKSISFPNGRKIPIRSDGTALINPSAARSARRVSLNALALSAEQHERQVPMTTPLDDLTNQIVLVRAATNPFESADVFATIIASIQTNAFIRRVSPIFDCLALVIVVAASVWLWKLSSIDLLLGAIALTAAYCLIALGLMSRWNIWLPAVLPLGAIWAVVVFSFIMKKQKAAKP